MKFNDNFELQDVCGSKVLLATGVEHINFNSMINLNESAAYIYTTFKGREFTIEEAVKALGEEYGEGMDEAVAKQDLQQLFADLKAHGIVAD